MSEEDLQKQLEAIKAKQKEHEKAEHELAGCVFILFAVALYLLVLRH